MTLTTAIITVAVVLGVFLTYAVLAPVIANLGRFMGRTWLFCPEHQEYALIGVNPLGAAFTAGYGSPSLAVRRCTLRKPGEVCDERCLEGADF